MIVTNFKTYEEGTGSHASRLAKIIAKVSREKGIRIIATPQFTDISNVAKFCETFAQHIDAINFGANTGWILPEAVKAAGATGTFINHSEHRLSMKEIEKRIKRARQVGLETLVCVATSAEVKKVKAFRPDWIAIEPPELIGSGKSVSTERPELVSRAVEAGRPRPVLCGAGVTNGRDVKKALELGAKGVLIASGFVKASNPEKVLRELCDNFG